MLWGVIAFVFRYSINCTEFVAHSYEEKLQGVTPKGHCKPTLGVVGVLVRSFGPATIYNYSNAGDFLVETVRGNCMLLLFLSHLLH